MVQCWVTAGDRNAVRPWQMAGERIVRQFVISTTFDTLILNGQTDHITSVAFGPDGRQVLTASTDQTLWVWDTEEAYT